MTIHYQLAIAYAQIKAAELSLEINEDVLEAFKGTNLGEIVDGLLLGNGSTPIIHHTDDDGMEYYQLNTGTIVCMEIIDSFGVSRISEIRRRMIFGMDSFFVETDNVDQVYAALEQECDNGINERFSVSQSLTIFPYDATMIYFGSKYRHYEATPDRYAVIMEKVKEFLADQGLQDGLLIKGLDADDIIELLEGWEPLEESIDAMLRTHRTPTGSVIRLN